MRKRPVLSVLLLAFCVAIVSLPTKAQSGAGAGTSSGGQQQSTTPPPSQTDQNSVSMMHPHVSNLQPGQAYQRPTEKEKLKAFAFDTIGPYPIIGSALTGGVQQAYGTPPEWGGGAQGYGQRVASAFGINLVTQSTRYGLSEIFREDTLYYRCECTGFGHRLEHALISTVTARRGDDGHRVFSIPALVAPYAGTEAAALLWYPGRYDASDGFRTGNYNLLVQAGLNVAIEFIWGGPHTLLGQHHVPVISTVTGSDSKQ
jgi:nitrate reductase NapE component